MTINYTYQSPVGKWFATVSGEYDGASDAKGLARCYGEGNTKQQALEDLLEVRGEYL